jgi:hypothetical protein
MFAGLTIGLGLVPLRAAPRMVMVRSGERDALRVYPSWLRVKVRELLWLCPRWRGVLGCGPATPWFCMILCVVAWAEWSLSLEGRSSSDVDVTVACLVGSDRPYQDQR